MTITIDDFKKADIRVGKIVSAEPIPGSEKLLKLSVDFGLKPKDSSEEQREVRQILSGIAKFFPNGEGLVGIKCCFVVNLEPRMMMGLESQGMLLATSGTHDGKDFFSVLKVGDDVPEGSGIN